MNLSPDEAGEALASIQKVANKTRHSLVNSGAYIFLIITGAIWMIGFLATQFLTGPVVSYIWLGSSLIGSALAVWTGQRRDKRMRSANTAVYLRRILIFWLALVGFCVATIAVAGPLSSQQMTMFIVLFILLGQFSMGLVFSFKFSWWALPLTALALAGYFLLPDLMYLWMAVLVGGGMIGLGLFIRFRW